MGLNWSNETPRLFTQKENSQPEKTDAKPSDIQDRAESRQGYGLTGVPQDSTSVHGAKEYALMENTEKGNIPPEGAEVPHSGKTYIMQFMVDFTAAIRQLVLLLVPHYIFVLFSILCQKLKRISSVFHDKCDRNLPNNGCSDQAHDNQDTTNSVENKKPKSVRTKLTQRQSLAHDVPHKHKNLAQEIGNAVSKPAPSSADKVEKLSKVEIPTTLRSKENAAVCGDKVRRKKILPDSTKNYQKHYQQKTTAKSVENHLSSEAKTPDVVR